MSETTIRSELQGIADAHAQARADMAADQVQSPIGQQLHRMGDVTEVVMARLAQLEDRLGPVRSPLDRQFLTSDEPMPPISPLADRLRLHTDALEHVAARLDQLLADIEL